MSKVLPQTEAKVIHDRRTCVVCHSGRSHDVPLAAEQNYELCSLVYFPEKFGPAMPVTNLKEQCDEVFGVVKECFDTTGMTEAEVANCKLEVVADDVEFDANLMCWPKGTSEEVINWFIQTNKCLRFRNVLCCSEVPDFLLDRIQVTSVKQSVKTPVVEKQAQKGAAAGGKK